VRCGGGTNHRLGLYDGILIKENHIMAAGGVAPVLAQARPGAGRRVHPDRGGNPGTARGGAGRRGEMILLDNMDLAQMRKAVARTAGRAVLEASGGVDLSKVRAIAETGVDRISIGSLTKDVRAIDLSLRHVEK
jgi:nicotinate-nucleotide pyrophosphorylase (carboxylating)